MRWLQAANINLSTIKKDHRWSEVASDEQIKKTIAALLENGIDAEVVETRRDAKKKVFGIIPKNAEVMTHTSVTLDTLEISKEINESGNFDAVRPKLMAMNRETQGGEMQKLGAAADWSIGSVHAVTEDGKVVIASNSGSQIPGYAYGSGHVIWVVGAQKIVHDLDEALERVNKHSLPLEAERVNKAYGVPGSFVSKMLIINQETVVGRIKMIIIKEVLGF